MKKLVVVFLIFFTSKFYGQTVVPFLNDLVAQFPNVRDLAISELQNEIYFTAKSFAEDISVIVRVDKIDDTWSSPQISKFSGKYTDLEPFLTSDGLRLYFVSNRPIDSEVDTVKDFDIWYVKRDDINSKWSAPENLGLPINTEYNEFFPSLAENKNIYFTCDYPSSKGKDDIFVSEFKDGKYAKPTSMSNSINTDGYEFNSFISKDESFIIFSGYERKDGFGSGDLYISFKDKNNSWTVAQNLGIKINSDKMDYCPFVDENNKILYFTSKRFKKNTHEFSNMTQLQEELNKYENGQSRIYKVKIDSVINSK